MTSIQRVLILLCICTSFVWSATKNISVQFILHQKNVAINGAKKVTIGLFKGKTLEDPIVQLNDVIVTFNAGLMVQNFPIADPHELELSELYVGLKMDAESIFVPLVSVPLAIFSEYAKEAKTLEDIDDWLKIDTETKRVGIRNLNPRYALDVSGNVGILGDLFVSKNIKADTFYGDGSNITNLQYANIENVERFYLVAKQQEGDVQSFDGNDYVVFVDEDKNVGIGVTQNIKGKVQIVGTLNVEGSYSGVGGFDVNHASLSRMLWDPSNGFFGVGNNNNESMATWGNNGGSIVLGSNLTMYSDFAAILGGNNQLIGSDAKFSSIVGGEGNLIYSEYSGAFSGRNSVIYGDHSVIIGGGVAAKIYASHAIVLGGKDNVIWHDGDYSVAMGLGSTVKHPGVFMFSDSTDTTHESVSPNQFLIFAENGVGIGTTNIFNTTKNTDKDGNKISISSNSLHVAGDLIVEGLLYGNGGHLKNVSPIWTSTDSGYIHYEKKVSIGTIDDPNSNSLLVQGSMLVNGSLEASPNAQSQHILGKSVLGTTDADVMRLSHFEKKDDAGSYAIEQSSSGATTLNAADAQNLVLAIKNEPKVIIDSNEVYVSVPLKVSGNITADSFIGNGEDLSNLKAFYLYGDSGNIVADTSGGFLDVHTGATINGSVLIKGDTSELVLEKNVDAGFKTVMSSSADSFDIKLIGYSGGDIFNVLGKDDARFLTIDNGGVISLGGTPIPADNNARLLVSGNVYIQDTLRVGTSLEVSENMIVSGVVSANSFVGDGSALTDLKIEASDVAVTSLTVESLLVSENIHVTGNVSVNGSLTLPPKNMSELDITSECSVNDSGKIFSISLNSNFDLCACKGADPVSLINNGVCGQ
jgi:hypothetical protein